VSRPSAQFAPEFRKNVRNFGTRGRPADRAILVIVLMGVSGSGKTTVGHLLASQLGWRFADADDYHPAANIGKMRNGIPLTDADRAPWLEGLRSLIANWLAAGNNAVLACSALKQAYREILRVSPDVRFVYLKGTPQLLNERLHARLGHFMTQRMLESQLAALEEPHDALVVDIAQSPEEIAAEVYARLELTKAIE
jgi:gluconokinase